MRRAPSKCLQLPRT
ncbi:unnamed protein product, partial [Didymodactylos carnosus]